MDPSQQHPPQPEQTQASSYAYDPNQSTYVYYQPSYQYAYYDPAQQAAYDAYYQQPHHEQPTPANPSGTQFPPQPQSEPVAAAAAAPYQYSYYQQPQPQAMEYGGVYAPVAPNQIMQSSSHRGGRGRRGGRGGGRRSQPQNRSSAAPSGPVWPPPRMAWCELCRVECNTPEILEQHKNGKKHQKNVKVQQELQRVMAAKASQVQATEEVSSQPPSAVENTVVNGGEGQGSGQKRKMRGGGRGGGGKSFRRKLTEQPKPKGGHIPLICELCNVTCETQLVFQTHLKGKKHIANRKRFEESEAVFGHAATQALYPALQPILPAIPPDPQSNHLPGGGQQDLPLIFNHVPPTVTPVAAESAAALMNTTTTPTTALITPSQDTPS